MNEQAKELSAKKRYDFDDLCAIVRVLRGEGGCPWDRAQTHASIRSCAIEEAYEVAEAIDKNDPVLLCEELGDLLFQAVFHAQLEAERGGFTIGDVVDGNARKMIRYSATKNRPTRTKLWRVGKRGRLRRRGG